MPKIVDHEERRRELVAAVVSVIMREGIERCTLRSIARESGYSSGVLAHYFADKEDLLTSALELSHDRIYARLAEKLEPMRGLAAVREFVLDNLPLDDERLTETRLELTYWARSLGDPRVLEVQRRESARLRGLLVGVLEDAARDGELAAGEDAETIAERLLAFIDGVSLHATLYPERMTPDLQHRLLDAELGRLRASTTPAPPPARTPTSARTRR
jgi:AcrR family transcriptional regulator